MKESIWTGICFGVTSAIITTLGLIVGLNAGTHSRIAVVGGVIMIAIADSFSDALGIHITVEAGRPHTTRQVCVATVATFGAKFLFALTFLAPVLLLPLDTAVLFSFIWGMLALTVLSVVIARSQGEAAWKIVAEHLAIALVVIAITYLAGIMVRRYVC